MTILGPLTQEKWIRNKCVSSVKSSISTDILLSLVFYLDTISSHKVPILFYTVIPNYSIEFSKEKFIIYNIIGELLQTPQKADFMGFI